VRKTVTTTVACNTSHSRQSHANRSHKTNRLGGFGTGRRCSLQILSSQRDLPFHRMSYARIFRVYTASHRSGTFTVMQVSKYLVSIHDTRYRKRYAVCGDGKRPMLVRQRYVESSTRTTDGCTPLHTAEYQDYMQVPARLDRARSLRALPHFTTRLDSIWHQHWTIPKTTQVPSHRFTPLTTTCTSSRYRHADLDRQRVGLKRAR
jgi:hypothetical protein